MRLRTLNSASADDWRDVCFLLYFCVQVAKLSNHMPHVLDLCVIEMVVRAAKHVLKVRSHIYHLTVFRLA